MRLGAWSLPLERLSATSLSTYAACPEQFRRKYLLKETEKLSGERFMGSVHHESLRLLFSPEFWVQGPKPRDAVGVAWQKIIEQDGEPDWHDLDATEAFKRAQLMIETYWPIAQTAEPVNVEQRFEEEILGVTVVGYIDLELPTVIREVKTSSRKESKPKSRWRMQGRLYSLVTAKPIEWHVVTRQVTPQVVTPETAPALRMEFNRDVTVKMIRDLIESMSDDYARHGANEPWALSGAFGDYNCDYCSFRKNGCIAWL